MKPAITRSLDQRFQIDASHFSVRAIPLTYLIEQAFDVNQYQVSGAPAWSGKDLWSINASIVGPADRMQVMEMLRNLLIDRFRLKTHPETRQTKVYELTVAKGGLRTGGTEGFLGWRTIPDLVKFLNGTTGPGAVGWPVVDRTGLSGQYNFRLQVELHTDPDGRSGTYAVDYLAELPRQLGLRLEAAHDDYPFLVIDRVEEPTPE
ncbi:MAG TPA: TIGR03435 family protein [Bryobacteraceae bacterium]|nr:TIGR03435 family protein [Bryobacteraceae bacterium]